MPPITASMQAMGPVAIAMICDKTSSFTGDEVHHEWDTQTSK